MGSVADRQAAERAARALADAGLVARKDVDAVTAAVSAAIEEALRNNWPTLLDENLKFRGILMLARETLNVVDDWLGHASTRQAATDSLWRLGRALERVGFPWTAAPDSLKWRGSLVRELNAAGFFHSDAKDAFVFDPAAWTDRPARVFGNAVGPTLQELVDTHAYVRECFRELGRLVQCVDPAENGQTCAQQTDEVLEWCLACRAVAGDVRPSPPAAGDAAQDAAGERGGRGAAPTTEER